MSMAPLMTGRVSAAPAGAVTATQERPVSTHIKDKRFMRPSISAGFHQNWPQGTTWRRLGTMCVGVLMERATFITLCGTSHKGSKDVTAGKEGGASDRD